MSGRPWYKRFPEKFLGGIDRLDTEEIALYCVALELMYRDGQPIERDHAWLGRYCSMSTRKVGARLDKLIAKGKIVVLPDGRLTNTLFAKVAAEGAAEHAEYTASGRIGGMIRAKNAAENTPIHTPISDGKRENIDPIILQKSQESATFGGIRLEPTPKHLQNIEIEEEVESKTESPSDSLPHQPASQPDGQSGPAEGFDSWWEAYPRKVGKIAARAAYLKARKRGATDAELLAAVTAQQWSPEVQFQPHPETWLSQGRWYDDPAAAAPRPPQASLPLLRSVTGDLKPQAPARPPLPALGDPPEAWFGLSEERGTRDGVTHAVVGAGSCLDLLCQSVCEAAGFRDASWRGDWQTVIAWVRDGIPRDQILSGVAEQAAWIRQKGGEPPRTLKNFDSAVRRTGRAA